VYSKLYGHRSKAQPDWFPGNTYLLFACDRNQTIGLIEGNGEPLRSHGTAHRTFRRLTLIAVYRYLGKKAPAHNKIVENSTYSTEAYEKPSVQS